MVGSAKVRIMFENQQLYEQLNEIFFSYEHVESTTWLYLTTLLSIAVFFKFGLFSMRNLDIILSLCFLLALCWCPMGRRTDFRKLNAWVMSLYGAWAAYLFCECSMIARWCDALYWNLICRLVACRFWCSHCLYY